MSAKYAVEVKDSGFSNGGQVIPKKVASKQ
jgi:hypothetical protein